MIGPAIEDEAVHLSADPQAIEFASHKFDAREALSRRRRFVARPFHYCPGHQRLIRVPISLLLGKHMPDDNQQFAGDRHNGFLLPDTRREPLELHFPIGVVLDVNLLVLTC